jgi:ketosteroid isomerase-like protein
MATSNPAAKILASTSSAAARLPDHRRVYELAKAMEVTGGRFREEVEDVLANDQHAGVLARHRFTRDGQSRDYKTAHVYNVRDGKLAAGNSRRICRSSTRRGLISP